VYNTFMPIYLACDLANGSDAYTTMLEALSDYHYNDPLVASHVRIHLIGFSPEASLFGSLSRDSVESLTFPAIGQSDTTGYRALFELVAASMEGEIRQAKISRDRIFRPLLIVITKTSPSVGDEFRQTYQTLMSTKWHPSVMAISLSQGAATTAARLATIAAFTASGIEPITTLIREVMRDLHSSRAADDTSIRIPGYIEGLVRLKPLS